jgi:hypothetical protein
VQGGEDLFVLLPYVHHHSTLRRWEGLPPSVTQVADYCCISMLQPVCCGSMNFFGTDPVRRIHTMDADPDPHPDAMRILLFSVSDLQDINPKIFYIFLLLITHFSKIKSHTEVTKNSGNQCFFILFLLYDKGSGAGSVSLTNVSGSGRPKNICFIRIRVRNTGLNHSTLSKIVENNKCRL